MKLGRRLGVEELELQDIEQRHRQLCERGYHMLMGWKHKDGSAATYQILNAALQHELVQRKDLAQQICYNQGNYFQQLWIIRNNWNDLFYDREFCKQRLTNVLDFFPHVYCKPNLLYEDTSIKWRHADTKINPICDPKTRKFKYFIIREMHLQL